MRAHTFNFEHFGLVIAAAALLFLTCLARSDSMGSQDQPHPTEDCLRCHNCDAPTSDKPCLRQCTRDLEQKIAKQFASKHGPDVTILGELADLYLPVPFDHKGHAAMAEMAGGCSACHHYTPEGAQHPACRTCHETGAGKGDIHKPGLKGAYHRQCLSCHREWGGEASCNICHQPKAGAHGESPTAIMPTPDDLIGQMHPPIPEPDMEIYRTEREGYPATRVLFRHKEHIHDYDLRCSDCHREDNCNRCHAANNGHVQHVRTLDEHHKPCFECHQDDTCEKCHFEEGQPPPSPFVHAMTGWPMSRYHKDASCRACHQAAPYVALDTKCDSCHSAWESGAFDHTITGYVLDETHVEFDCEDCHADRNFAVPPSCDSCHDEDENIGYPRSNP